VTSATNEILEYDGTTGAFVRAFVAAADNVSALDLNPVVVHPCGSGVSVVDALIITDNDNGAGTHPLATD
jgi:hypothetical protein